MPVEVDILDLIAILVLVAGAALVLALLASFIPIPRRRRR